MIRYGVALLAVGLVVGCQPAEQRQAAEKGKEALEHSQKAAAAAGDMIGIAFRSALKQTQGVDAKSSAEELAQAKKKLESAKPASATERSALQAELERIRAATDLQKLRSEIDRRVQMAARQKENAEKSLDEVRAQMERADAAFRDLSARAKTAEGAYSQAKDAVSGMLRKAEGLLPPP